MDKPFMIVFLIILTTSSIVITVGVTVPILLSPNTGLEAGNWEDNYNEVNEYIDKFIEEEMREDIISRIVEKKELAEENKERFNEKQNDLIKLIDEYNGFKIELHKNEIRIEKSKIQIEELKDEKKELESEIRSLENDISNLQNRISDERDKEKPDNNKINRLQNQISNKRSEISNKEEKINDLQEEIKKFEEIIKDSEKRIEVVKPELESLKSAIDEISKKYEETQNEMIKYRTLGLKTGNLFTDLRNWNQFKDNLKDQIDIMFLMEINAFAREDALIEDEDVKVDGLNFKVNSKDLIFEALEYFIERNTYNKYKIKDKTYPRVLEIFQEEFEDEYFQNPVIEKVYKESEDDSKEPFKIEFFERKKVDDYYIRNDHIEILKDILSDNTKLSKIAREKNKNNKEVLDLFKARLQHNWLLRMANIQSANFANYSDFEDWENEFKNRSYDNQELVDRSMQFKYADISYIPRERLDSDIYSLNQDKHIELSDYLIINDPESAKKELENSDKFNRDYIIIQDKEKKIWEDLNEIKEEDKTCSIENVDSPSETIRLENINNVHNGKLVKPNGLGHKGFLDHLFPDEDFEGLRDLYLNSQPVFEEEELKEGDLAMYYNPETREFGNKLGVYAGGSSEEREFYHFNSYKEDVEDVEFVRDTAEFNIFMRYYPRREEN